jgi:hypothetical protein
MPSTEPIRQRYKALEKWIKHNPTKNKKTIIAFKNGFSMGWNAGKKFESDKTWDGKAD